MKRLHARSVSITFAGLCGMTLGCGWTNVRSDFDRDPFVMSHLTHSKQDPTFAISDSEADFDRQELVKAASISRKRDYVQNELAARGDSHWQEGHAKDYRWLRGRLGFKRGQRGESGSWFIRYAGGTSKDQYGGEIRVDDSPKLGIVREGDPVYLEGEIVSDGHGNHKYRVDTLALLD